MHECWSSACILIERNHKLPTNQLSTAGTRDFCDVHHDGYFPVFEIRLHSCRGSPRHNSPGLLWAYRITSQYPRHLSGYSNEICLDGTSNPDIGSLHFNFMQAKNLSIYLQVVPSITASYPPVFLKVIQVHNFTRILFLHDGFW